MAQINFPAATADGQQFEADNGVIYTYIGTPPNGYWSGSYQVDGIDTLDTRYLKLDSSNDPVTNGLTVTGVVTATSYSGDGSTLTGIDATSLKDSGGNVIVQAGAGGIDVTGSADISGGIEVGGLVSSTTFGPSTDADTYIAFPGSDVINIYNGAVASVMIDASQNVTISGNLSVTGTITATDNITAYSDISIKENIQSIPNALDKVLQLRGVEFDRTDLEGEHQIGVIAQEVESVIPEVVVTGEEGLKSVAYGNLVGLLIEAVKDLNAEVNELKAKLEG